MGNQLAKIFLIVGCIWIDGITDRSAAQSSFPTTEEFMNALGTCATTQSIQIDANFRGSVENIYRGARTEGYARILNQSRFLEAFPEKDKLAAYRLYTNCIVKILPQRTGTRPSMPDKCETAGLEQCRADYRSNPTSALLSCQKFLECDPSNRAALSILANSYRSLGRMAEAEGIYNQLLDLAERSGDAAVQAQAYQQIATMHLANRSLERADFFIKRSLEINVRLGDLVGQGANYRAIGDLNGRRGNLAEAERNFRQAISILGSTADRLSLAQAHMGLGHVYRARREASSACSNFRTARGILVQENFPRGVADVDRAMQQITC